MGDNPAKHKGSKPAREAEVTKPKMTKVIEGSAKTRKNPTKKLSDTFLSEDISNVKTYLFSEVIVPAIKDLLCDAVTNGIRMMLYSDDRPSRRDRNYHTPYDKYSDRDRDRRREDSPRRSRGVFSYEDIEFDTRADAELVWDRMQDAIDEFGTVSVLEMYDSAGLDNNNPQANKYGWIDLQGTRVVRTSYGKYYLKLPKAAPID